MTVSGRRRRRRRRRRRSKSSRSVAPSPGTIAFGEERYWLVVELPLVGEDDELYVSLSNGCPLPG